MGQLFGFIVSGFLSIGYLGGLLDVGELLIKAEQTRFENANFQACKIQQLSYTNTPDPLICTKKRGSNR